MLSMLCQIKSYQRNQNLGNFALEECKELVIIGLLTTIKKSLKPSKRRGSVSAERYEDKDGWGANCIVELNNRKYDFQIIIEGNKIGCDAHHKIHEVTIDLMYLQFNEFNHSVMKYEKITFTNTEYCYDEIDFNMEGKLINGIFIKNVKLKNMNINSFNPVKRY